MVWDTTKPQGTRAANLGDDDIRELKTDLQTSLRAGETEGNVAIFPGADTSNPKYEYRGRRGASASRPIAGQNGLWADTTTNNLYRDNGTSWQGIATYIPSGTVMVFYQAAAPTGWTKITAVNDRALRVVSGSSGGSTGGTHLISAGVAHTHTHSHVHDIPRASVEHHHLSPTIYDTNTGVVFGVGENPYGNQADIATTVDVGTFNAVVGAGANRAFQKTSDINGWVGGDTDVPDDSTTAESSPIIAYADVILASKDA